MKELVVNASDKQLKINADKFVNKDADLNGAALDFF